MKCSRCNNPNVQDIRGGGGAIVARVCLRCGKKSDRYGEEIVVVAEKKPEPPAKKPEECRHAGLLQDVRDGYGQVIAKVCGLCHARFRMVTCVGCGTAFHAELDDRRKFPACSSACSTNAAKARAKAKRAEEGAKRAPSKAVE